MTQPSNFVPPVGKLDGVPPLPLGTKGGHGEVVVAELLFSYGTLQQESVQLAQFGRRLSGQADALLGWRTAMVEITDPDVLEKSGMAFHPIVMPGRKDDQVSGMVFEITADELAAADSYEVSDYKRVAAQLASGKTAWVYVKA